MKITEKYITASQWGKTHRVFILVLLSSLVVTGLVAWYYVAFSRPTIDATINSAKDAKPVPMADVTPKDDMTTHDSLVEIESTPTGDTSSNPSTTVKIDGQPVNVSPGNPERHVIQDPNGTTTIDVSVNNSSTAGKSSNSSTTTIESNSSTEINSSSKSSQSVP